MATEPIMNTLTEAGQALASIALPPVNPSPRSATVALQIKLGRAKLRLDEAHGLKKGAVVPLDKLAGDWVDVYAGDRLAARGEIVAVNGSLGVRVVKVRKE